MLQLFQEFVTPQQKELAAKLKQMGGGAVLENEQAMKELVGLETTLTANPRQSWPGGDRRFNFIELLQEVKSDPEEVIKKNTQFFDRKFDIQWRQIVKEIARTAGREGDRIIPAVTPGPHDRIVDPVYLVFEPCATHISPGIQDVYSIWRDMVCACAVQSRYFVTQHRDGAGVSKRDVLSWH